MTGARTVTLATEHAGDLGLKPGDRVLSTLSYDDWAGLGGGLLAPLAAGASVVLCRNSEQLSPEQLEQRISSERVTHQIG